MSVPIPTSSPLTPWTCAAAGFPMPYSFGSIRPAHQATRLTIKLRFLQSDIFPARFSPGKPRTTPGCFWMPLDTPLMFRSRCHHTSALQGKPVVRALGRSPAAEFSTNFPDQLPRRWIKKNLATQILIFSGLRSLQPCDQKNQGLRDARVFLFLDLAVTDCCSLRQAERFGHTHARSNRNPADRGRTSGESGIS